jgi:hypothetical protein
MSRLARARARGILLAMLEGPQTNTIDTLSADDAVLVARDLLERMQGELKFKQAKI